MKRFFCLLMIVIISACVVLPSSATTMQSSRISSSADDTGTYVVSFSGKHICITRYSFRNLGVEFDVEHNISAVCAYRGRVVILCDNAVNDQLLVYVYYLDSDLLDGFAIYGGGLYGNTDFGCDNDRFYIEDPDDSSRLDAYSYSGAFVKSYFFNDDITSVTGGYHSGFFVTAGKTLYTLSGNDFNALGGTSVSPPLFSADADVMVSAYGKVYVLDGDSISSDFSVDTDHQAASACVIGECLFYPCGSMIYGYDIYTGEKLCYYRNSFNAALLYANGDSVIAVGGGSSVAINRGVFTYLDTSSSDGSDSQWSNSQSADDSDTAYTISSDVYTVDTERYHITGIPSGTTVSVFKSNMYYNGYSVEIYRNNSLRKSGYVGTAMTAVFTGNSGSFTFELGVSGDITGEGNVNSRDLNLLMDYLIGAVDFNGVYLTAADVSGDSTVDAVDLALLKNII